MADNINSFNDDTVNSPLPINEARLQEMKSMEESEQSLIDDLFSTQVKVNAPTKDTLHSSQKNLHLLKKKATKATKVMIIKNSK